MKRVIRCLFSIALVSGLMTALTVAAQWPEPRFYVRGGMGGSVVEDTGLKEFPFLGSLSGVKVKFDPGFQFRVAGGFYITPWLATELETGATYNTIKSISGAAEADGSLVNAPLLANLVIQCPRKCLISPYIGGGLGGSSSVLSADDLVLPDGTGGFVGIHGTQSTAVFAYHGFGGLRFNIDRNMAVSVDYRFFGTTAPEWKSDFGVGNDRIKFGDNHTHSITAAFTYSF